MNIEELRAQIDEVDDELLSLLNKRTQLVLEIAAHKRAANIPLYDPDRERFVVERACFVCPGPLDHAAVHLIFRCLIGESRRIAAATLCDPGNGEAKRPEQLSTASEPFSKGASRRDVG